MMENISNEEYKRLKKKLMIRYFVFLPIVILISAYVTRSLADGEFISLGDIMPTVSGAIFAIIIIWVFSKGNEIKREQKQELKTKRRMAIEYSIIALLFLIILVVSYTM